MEADIAKLMAGEKADMVFTDPPYGIDLETDYSSMKANPRMFHEKGLDGGNKYNKVVGDDTPFDPAILMGYFSYCSEQFWWGADYYSDRIIQRDKGSWIVWDKRLEESADLMYGSCFELCWSRHRHKRDIARVKWAGVFGVEKEPERRRLHPTQKPVALAEWFIERYSKLKHLIIDLYGGSGSTLIACEKLGRRCFMMEIDEHYCDVIIQRWQNYTGKEAVKV